MYVLLSARPDLAGSGESDARTYELRDRIAYLEGLVETRDEKIRRRDTIILSMTEAVMALNQPTPPTPTEASAADAEQNAEDQGGADRGGYQRLTAAQRPGLVASLISLVLGQFVGVVGE